MLDLGQYIAAPLATKLLADAGAHVVHIDPPGGAVWQAAEKLNWGKELLTLDLKNSTGRAIFSDLLAAADVLVEGFRPGVIGRLIGHPEDLRRKHPRLITCSLPGFSSNDPRAPLRAWEDVVLAGCGAMIPIIADTKWLDPSNDPRPPSFAIASNFGAIVGALSVSAALIDRERTGTGQGIEVSLFDAMFECIGDVGTWFDDEGPNPGPRDRFGGGTYRCSDGRWVQFNTQNPDFLMRFCEKAHLQPRFNAEGLLDISALAFDSKLRDRLKSNLAIEFAGRRAADWDAIAAEANVAFSICRTYAEWQHEPHAKSAKVIPPGRSECPAVSISWEATAGLQSRSQRVEGQSAERPAILPLDGLRVIDVSSFLAGPTAGRVLAQHGAAVVKLCNPSRDVHKHHYVNRGKHTIMCNLREEAGRRHLMRLTEHADVFLHNGRPAACQRLGIDASSIYSVNPSIIYSAVHAYGTPGPWDGRPGYETQGQACSGLMMLRGSGIPSLQPLPVTDYGTGLLTAFGIMCAVYGRSTHAGVYRVEGSLARTATMFQLVDRFGEAGRLSRPEVLIVSGLDGWALIAGMQACLASLYTAWGGDELALRVNVAALSVDEIIDVCSQFQLSCVRILNLEQAVADPITRRLGLAKDYNLPDGRKLTCVEPGRRFDRTELRAGPSFVPPMTSVEKISGGWPAF